MPDLGATLTNLLPALNAASMLTLSFWTEDELYAFADEAAKRLARKVGVWVERDTSAAVSSLASTYTLPTRRVSIVHVSLGAKALKAASAAEMEALDDAWVDTTGTPLRFLLDIEGTGKVRLYPAPAVGVSGNLGVLYATYPTEIQKGSATVTIPAPLEEYFTFSVLAEARGREGEAAMPEVAEQFRSLVGMLEQVAESYWGISQ